MYAQDHSSPKACGVTFTEGFGGVAGVLLQKHKTLWTEYQANLSPESSGQRQVIQQPLPLRFLMRCPRDRTRSRTVSRCRHEEVAMKWMVRHRQDSDTWERVSGQRSKHTGGKGKVLKPALCGAADRVGGERETGLGRRTEDGLRACVLALRCSDKRQHEEFHCIKPCRHWV